VPRAPVGPACAALEQWLRRGGPRPPGIDAALREDAAVLRALVLAAAAHPLERGRLAGLLTLAQLDRILPPPSGEARRFPPRRTRHRPGVAPGRLLDRAVHAARRGGAAPALAAALARAGAEHARQALVRDDLPLSQVPTREGTPVEVRELPLELPRGVEFHVPNAGLILLWRFLSHYFGALGMLDGRDFAGEAQRSRAVHLLHYLASGVLDAPEHDLLLAKVLCGWEYTAPLLPCAPLTAEERHRSGQLLTTVTQHWPVLKNTSHDGLRGTFLMRAGSLALNDERWTLAVAPGPYDVLLQTLPWPRSMVRCAWMKDVLWVQWP
jgi:hypothetical protein